MEDTLAVVTRELPDTLERFEERYEDPGAQMVEWFGRDVLMCDKCGSLVLDVIVHLRWHKNLSLGTWMGVDFIVSTIIDGIAETKKGESFRCLNRLKITGNGYHHPALLNSRCATSIPVSILHLAKRNT